MPKYTCSPSSKRSAGGRRTTKVDDEIVHFNVRLCSVFGHTLLGFPWLRAVRRSRVVPVIGGPCALPRSRRHDTPASLLPVPRRRSADYRRERVPAGVSNRG